jgi:hypothetical protein
MTHSRNTEIYDSRVEHALGISALDVYFPFLFLLLVLFYQSHAPKSSFTPGAIYFVFPLVQNQLKLSFYTQYTRCLFIPPGHYIQT